MTARTRALDIVDADLEQAIDDLRYVVIRIRQLDRLLSEAHDGALGKIAAMRDDRADNWAKVRVRAEKLQIVPDNEAAGARALRTIVEEAWRLRTRTGRKVPLRTLRDALAVAEDAAASDAQEIEADIAVSQYLSRAARVRAAAAQGARAYIDRSAA